MGGKERRREKERYGIEKVRVGTGKIKYHHNNNGKKKRGTRIGKEKGENVKGEREKGGVETRNNKRKKGGKRD